MILPDFLINDWGRKGGIDQFDPTKVNPASIDLAMGQSYIDLEMERAECALTGPLLLKPGQAILATTAEYIKLTTNVLPDHSIFRGTL